MKAEHVCVKISNLRLLDYNNIEEWVNGVDNIYVGRTIRMFIQLKDRKKVYWMQQSKWANPYKVAEYGLDECLKLYKEYLYSSGLIKDIGELKGKKLGCFCEVHQQCHAKILVELVNETDS